MGNMNNNCMSCQNVRRDVFREDVALGMGYIPWQVWGDVYDLNKGHCQGTIFPCLDKPFMGRCACK